MGKTVRCNVTAGGCGELIPKEYMWSSGRGSVCLSCKQNIQLCHHAQAGT